MELENKEFHLLSRAQFIARPPVRRIVSQWDLSKVLDLLSTDRFNNETAVIADLLMKTLFLIALTSGNMVSELSAISRNSISFRDSTFTALMAVKRGFLYKNQRLNRSPPNICINPLNPDGTPHILCPLSAMKAYLGRTSESSCTDSFFVHPTTDKALQGPSISLWLCKLIEMASPGSFTKAHDIRKCSASLAWVRGVSPDEITKSAFWVTSSTFISRWLYLGNSSSLPCVALGSSHLDS